MSSTQLHYKSITDLLHEGGLSIQDLTLTPVSGGSINKTYKLQADNKTFFCKINSATKFPHLFEKEANGLALLRSSGTIYTPEVINCTEEKTSKPYCSSG